jgi:hypothetical protein
MPPLPYIPQEPAAAVEAQAMGRVFLENCKLVTKREDLHRYRLVRVGREITRETDENQVFVRT